MKNAAIGEQKVLLKKIEQNKNSHANVTEYVCTDWGREKFTKNLERVQQCVTLRKMIVASIATVRNIIRYVTSSLQHY